MSISASLAYKVFLENLSRRVRIVQQSPVYDVHILLLFVDLFLALYFHMVFRF